MIQALSAYLIGAVYKDVVVYSLFLGWCSGCGRKACWARHEAMAAVSIGGVALLVAWPLLISTPFLQRLGALVLLAAISASAWNMLGGYAGQVSVGHAVYFGCGAYAALVVYTHFGCRRWPDCRRHGGGVAMARSSACRRSGCAGTISPWPRSPPPNWCGIVAIPTSSAPRSA